MNELGKRIRTLREEHGFTQESFANEEVQNINQVKNLFEMVYQWGRANVVVDYKAPTFQRAIKMLKQSGYICPVTLEEAPELDEACGICGIII